MKVEFVSFKECNVFVYRVSRLRLKAEIFLKFFVIWKKVSNEGRVILRGIFKCKCFSCRKVLSRLYKKSIILKDILINICTTDYIY